MAEGRNRTNEEVAWASKPVQPRPAAYGAYIRRTELVDIGKSGNETPQRIDAGGAECCVLPL